VANPHPTSRAVVGTALVALPAGHLAEADRILAGCQAATRELGVPWGLALVLSNHGRIVLELGETARAEALLQESITILGQLHDTGGSWKATRSTGSSASDAGAKPPYSSDRALLKRCTGKDEPCRSRTPSRWPQVRSADPLARQPRARPNPSGAGGRG
jgi:hypothetical protein